VADEDYMCVEVEHLKKNKTIIGSDPESVKEVQNQKLTKIKRSDIVTTKVRIRRNQRLDQSIEEI
jgi:hypothetical protein